MSMADVTSEGGGSKAYGDQCEARIAVRKKYPIVESLGCQTAAAPIGYFEKVGEIRWVVLDLNQTTKEA